MLKKKKKSGSEQYEHILTVSSWGKEARWCSNLTVTHIVRTALTDAKRYLLRRPISSFMNQQSTMLLLEQAKAVCFMRTVLLILAEGIWTATIVDQVLKAMLVKSQRDIVHTFVFIFSVDYYLRLARSGNRWLCDVDWSQTITVTEDGDIVRRPGVDLSKLWGPGGLGDGSDESACGYITDHCPHAYNGHGADICSITYKWFSHYRSTGPR